MKRVLGIVMFVLALPSSTLAQVPAWTQDMSVRVGMAPRRGGLSAGVTFNW